MWPTIQPKFWPKKPVTQASGRNIVAMIVSCFITRVQPVRDGREVDVHRAGEQVAVAVDQVADPDQVVVDVAEVALVLLGHPGSSATPPIRLANVSRCGVTALRMPTSRRFIRKISCSCVVAGVQEDLVLELVDAVVEVGEDREEAVDEPVDDPVEQQRRVVDRLLALHVALTHLGERRAVVAVHGDEEALGVEAMHLDEAVLVRDRAVDDDEDEVVVLVDLRALAELLRVLDGQRMELEDVAQDLEVVLARLVDIEPEERVRRRAASRRSRG